MKKTRVILTGGFLGAGKTTSLLQLAKRLHSEGIKVGIILNDQGSNLVDGELVKSNGFATVEITGGCFCCRFQDLLNGFEKLLDGNDPDVLLAEPVGSCTDLISTVFFPLQNNFPGKFSLAPFTVVADGTILQSLTAGSNFPFSTEISYLYKKQLEEANIILINKTDLLEHEDLIHLKAALQERYPEKLIIPVCASNGSGFAEWIEALMMGSKQFYPLANIDYELYGKAEAMLGWYNSSLHIQCKDIFDPNDFIDELMIKVLSNIQKIDGKVAHLKVIGKCSGGLIKASITQAAKSPVFSTRGYDFTKELDIIINARVEIDAWLLKQAVNEAIYILKTIYDLNIKVDHEECFKPSYPTPTYPREAKCL